MHKRTLGRDHPPNSRLLQVLKLDPLVLGNRTHNTHRIARTSTPRLQLQARALKEIPDSPYYSEGPILLPYTKLQTARGNQVQRTRPARTAIGLLWVGTSRLRARDAAPRVIDGGTPEYDWRDNGCYRQPGLR